MDLGLQGRVAVAGAFQCGVRVALPMGKHSSVVFQLALDPDPGWVSPLLSSHLLSEDTGTLASTLSPLSRTGGHMCPGWPSSALVSLLVQNSCRSDSASATHPPACPRDHTSHTQVGAAAQSVSSEGDSA